MPWDWTLGTSSFWRVLWLCGKNVDIGINFITYKGTSYIWHVYSTTEILLEVVIGHSKGSGFEGRPLHLDFRDWVSPAFKSQYDCDIVKAIAMKIPQTTQINQLNSSKMLIDEWGCDLDP